MQDHRDIAEIHERLQYIYTLRLEEDMRKEEGIFLVFFFKFTQLEDIDCFAILINWLGVNYRDTKSINLLSVWFIALFA